MPGKGLKRSTPHRIAHRLGAGLHPAIAAILAAQAITGAKMLTPAPQADQGESSTCFSHSAIGCENTVNPTGFLGSPLLLAQCTYEDVRAAANPTGNLPPLTDDGAELQDAADAFRRWGKGKLGPQIAGRNGFSDVPDDQPGAPFPEADKDALEVAGHTLIAGEYSIPVDANAPLLVAAALEAGIPVWLGTYVGPLFESLASGQVAEPETTGGGGHAMYIIGYKTSDGSTAPNPGETVAEWLIRVMVVRIKNSWGRFWCENGECWASVQWLLACWDLWPFPSVVT
jgi:hypothetical protein